MTLFDSESQRNALTLLTRLSRRTGANLLRQPLTRRLRQLAEASIQVAKETGDPMGTVLAELLRKAQDPELAARMDEWIPDDTVELQELGLVNAQLVLAGLRGDSSQAEEHLAAIARWSGTLGGRLDRLNRSEEAHPELQEAVRLFRKLGASFQPGLAMALTNHAILLTRFDQYAAALPLVEEAVALRRSMAVMAPQDPFLPGLARSLVVLRKVLEALGRPDEALAAIQEAVRIYRSLFQVEPSDRFKNDRASALLSLANALHGFGRHEEALRAAEESAVICFGLQEANPDAFRPAFGGALLQLSNRLADLSRHEEALRACQRATEIYRSLTLQDHLRRAFLPDLARALNNFANCLSHLERYPEALVACEEAALCFQELKHDHPEAFTAGHAVSLNTLARRLLAVGREAEASARAAEALVNLAPLFLEQPAAFVDWMRRVLADYKDLVQPKDDFPNQGLVKAVGAALAKLQETAPQLSENLADRSYLPQWFIASVHADPASDAELDEVIAKTQSLIAFLGYRQDGEFVADPDRRVKRARYLLPEDLDESEVRRKVAALETVQFRYTQIDLDSEARGAVESLHEVTGRMASFVAVDVGVFAFIQDPDRTPLSQNLTKRLTETDRRRLDEDPTLLQKLRGSPFRP